MSENLDHETGGTYASLEIMTVKSSNIKIPSIGTVTPVNPYDGTTWTDTNSDPPVLKTYDETNTDWMDQGTVSYTSNAFEVKPLTNTQHNGHISIKYGTGTGDSVI